MTDAELAILSIIAESPIRGHTIQTVITERGLRDWTHIGTSSLFYVLQKLERQGLLTSDAATPPDAAPPKNDPASREYRITPAGYGVLQTAVVDLLSTPHDTSKGLELGLANLYVLNAEQIRTAFAAYTQELASRLRQIRARRKRAADTPAQLNITAMFDRRIALLETEMAWLEDFIADWEAQAPPDDAPPLARDIADIPRMKQVILPHDSDSPHRAPTRPRDAAPEAAPPLSEAPTDSALSLPDADPPPSDPQPE